MTSPSHFEDELLTQLRLLVAQNPSPSPDAGRLRRPALRNRLVLSGGGLAVLGATAVILISGSGSATPNAYAVAAHGNGSVTVHVRMLSDAAGLQSSLRAAGIPAIVNYAPAGKLPSCPLPKGDTVHTESGVTSTGGASRGPGPVTGGPNLSTDGPKLSTSGKTPPAGLPTPPPGASVMSSSTEVTPNGVTFTISPGMVKGDEQVVITTSEGTLTSMGVAIVKRSVGACSAAPPKIP